MQPWNLHEQMLEAINKNGGFVNTHAHFDKAFYITKDGLETSMRLNMKEKWLLSDNIKRSSTQADIEERLRTALDLMISQGVKLTSSFVDAYEAVGHKAIDAALKVKEEYKEKIEFLIATQPLGGLVDPEARKLYEEVTAKADIAGGLPSKDRPKDDENYDILFSIAKNLNKPLHVHIDQENDPNERDTEKLINATIRHGYEGRTVAVHAISVSCQPKPYRQEIFKKMSDAGISVIVCPTEAINMVQLDQYTTPIHNCIGNVPEMLEAGLTVGIGTDNVYDYYGPFNAGEMWFELHMLMEACRYYNFDELVKIATVNGQKILNIK